MSAERAPIGVRQILNAAIVIVGMPISFSLLAGMYRMDNYDFMAGLFKMIGYEKAGFVTSCAIAAGLYFADEALEAYNGRFADELYGLIKDIGELVKAGESVEAAVQKATGWKVTPAARRFREALELSKDASFDVSLRHVAENSGQPAFRETAMLMAGAIDAGGDVGPALRWLAGHFSRLRQHEREFSEKLNGALMTMRGVALVAAPMLYRGLEWSLAGHSGEWNTKLSPATVSFFAWGSLWMASLDGLVYGSWSRVPARIPIYIALSRTFLGIW